MLLALHIHTAQMAEVRSAALNRNISHSAFRLYTLLSVSADRTIPKGGFASVSYAGLMKLLPGVKGKPVVLSTVKANLRELRRAYLIETSLSAEPDKYILVKLLKPGSVSADEITSRVLFERDSSE